MSDYITSKTALADMGEPFCEIQFAYEKTDSKERVKVADVENVIKKYTDIKARMLLRHIRMS